MWCLATRCTTITSPHHGTSISTQNSSNSCKVSICSSNCIHFFFVMLCFRICLCCIELDWTLMSRKHFNLAQCLTTPRSGPKHRFRVQVSVSGPFSKRIRVRVLFSGSGPQVRVHFQKGPGSGSFFGVRVHLQKVLGFGSFFPGPRHGPFLKF